MLKLASYDIVFQEVPGEVTLALNLSNCPNRCKGCHSPHLWDDIGDTLDETRLMELLERYGNSITCVCFMGGDNAPQEINRLASMIRSLNFYSLKTAWYSGKETLAQEMSLDNLDFLKLGAYQEQLGGLDSPTTNQRFYEIERGELICKNSLFLST